MGKDILQHPAVHVFLILLFTFLAYSNTFHVPFQFDDEPGIVNNQILKDLRYFLEPTKTEGFRGHFEYNTFKGRYFGYLTFALNYRLHGLDVTGYHIVNLLIHMTNAMLVYLFALLTFRTPSLQNSTLRQFDRHIALFTALLFACHPIQTQAVTYIWQRLTSLTTLFCLLCLVLYIRVRLNQTEGRGASAASTWGLYLLCLIAAVFAMKSKEIAFMLPVVVVLYEVIFFAGDKKRRVMLLIPLLLTMLIVPLTILGIDRPAGDLIGDVSEVTRGNTDLSRRSYLFTEIRVISTYLRLLVFPVSQNLDYDYPVYTSIFESGVFFSLCFLLIIAGGGLFLLYRTRKGTSPLLIVSYGILWFFLNLMVESSVIPLNNVIFEHRIYLPSIGVFLGVSTVCFMGMERLKGKGAKATVGILAVIVVVLAGSTYARNRVWQDEVSLWDDVVKKSPDKPRAHNNLGTAYRYKGLHNRAIEHYQRAIQLDPDYAYAYNNLGTAYRSRGQTDRAIENFRKAITLNPSYADAYNNLGSVYYSLGQTDRAIEHFKQAVQIYPNYLNPHMNLGIAYQAKGLIEKAEEQYSLVIRLDTSYADAYNNLGNIYQSMGKINKAVEHYRIAINLKPDVSGIHFNLGTAHKSLGLLGRAIENYQEAIRLAPDWDEPHFLLGGIYLEQGKKEEARRMLEQVLRINPDHERAGELIKELLQE
jgi:tetratricopeptide (TPR) repeat protein